MITLVCRRTLGGGGGGGEEGVRRVETEGMRDPGQRASWSAPSRSTTL